MVARESGGPKFSSMSQLHVLCWSEARVQTYISIYLYPRSRPIKGLLAVAGLLAVGKILPQLQTLPLDVHYSGGHTQCSGWSLSQGVWACIFPLHMASEKS